MNKDLEKFRKTSSQFQDLLNVFYKFFLSAEHFIVNDNEDFQV